MLKKQNYLKVTKKLVHLSIKVLVFLSNYI